MQVNVPQYFMPGTDGKQLRPMLYAAVDISLSNARLKLSETKRLLMTTPITDGPIPIDWNATHSTAVEPERLTTTVPIGATFQPLPAAASRASCYTKWGSQLKTWIRDTQSAQLYRSGSFVSRPDESLREFLARVDMVSRETRDSGVDRLREKYQSRRSALEEKVERAREAIARESQQAASQGMDVAISVGSVLAGAILGRRMSRRTGRAVRSAGRAAKQRGDVNRAREAYDKAVQELADFDAKFELEAGAIQAQRDEMKTVTVKPARDGIQLRLLALVWSPLEDA
jgi:hypothetical protein